jgi:hypothetical protein
MPANLARIVLPGKSPDILAVAVCKLREGSHAGIVHLGRNKTLELLHLAFHRNLRDDPFPSFRDRYVCVVPSLLRQELIALAGFCRRVHKANVTRRTIPFNLRYDEGVRLDFQTGDVVLPGKGAGMSCATFVLHFFRAARGPMLDATKWPSNRPGDEPRRKQCIAMLRANPDPDYQQQAHVLELDKGCPRISPQEAIGAFLEDVPPATFDHCEPNGRLIDALLDSWCPC